MSVKEKQAHEIYTTYLKYVTQMIGNKTTNSIQLLRIGKALLGHRFLGVFPSDKIPNLRNNECCIVNLDNSREKGSHWTAIYKFNDTKILLYDSFGRNLNKLLKVKGINTDRTDREQETKILGDRIEEINCGQRSIAWLLVCSNHGYDVSKLI